MIKIFIVVFVLPQILFAANHYVRAGATGSKNGADWTNAFATLPAALIRGDLYYVADGDYGSHTFNDVNSGTTLITVKKATSADHGTDVGWSASYGDGQATFESGWNISTDYYVFDGVSRNSDWQTGSVSQYGFRVANTRLDNGGGAGGDNLTFRYIDFHGGGRDTGNGDDVIYGLTGNTNVTFQFCALHDSDRTIFLMRGNWTNLVVDHSYLARNTSTPATHGEMLSMTDSTNVTWSYNVMEDIEGTGFIVGINGGTASNWKIFGNVFLHSESYIADTGRKAGHNVGVSGAIYIANDASNNNTGNQILFYNNTLVNIQGLWSGVIVQKGSGNEMKNNIWYNSVRTNASADVVSNNWYFNTLADGDSSATKTVCTTNCNLFVNLAAKNFHLTSATTPGSVMLSPYNKDPDGLVRGSDGVSDRGAYEFISGLTAAVPAPQNLKIKSKKVK